MTTDKSQKTEVIDLGLYYDIPATKICGLTLKSSKKQRKTLKDILLSLCNPLVKKAVIFVEDTEYILWDVLNQNWGNLVERVKYIYYPIYIHETYYRLIKKWYDGNKVRIHFISQDEHEDKFYLNQYEFNEKYEVVSAKYKYQEYL